MRSGTGKLGGGMWGLKSEMTAVRHDVRGREAMQDQHRSDIAAIKDRLEKNRTAARTR